jgi:F420-non-reducing hydrogenase iron-sulfur subunit
MTDKRMRFMQEFLGLLGLEGRLHFEWISSSEATKFVRVITDFTEKIRAMGPNPISGSMEITAKHVTPGRQDGKRFVASGG